MKLKNLLKLQRNLDEKIHETKRIDYNINKVRLAYLVELGELANEWQQFKYWKNNKNINIDRLKDEYADVLHFALSIENYFYDRIDNSEDMYLWNQYYEKIETILYYTKIEEDVIELLLSCYKEEYVLLNTLKLGLQLGFTLKQIEQIYINKNIINYKRLENNY